MAHRRFMEKNKALAVEFLENNQNGPRAIIKQHTSKKEIALLLFKALLSRNIEIVIVKTAISIFDIFHQQLIAFRSKELILYSITKDDDIELASSLLSRLQWHKPVFHIIMGSNKFSNKVLESIKLYKDINKVEQILANEIICYIDPIDDELQLYCNEFIIEIIKTL